MALDRELLVKLLNMTVSSHEGEVLAAIRRSNVLLQKAKTTWRDLLAVEKTAKAGTDAQGDGTIWATSPGEPAKDTKWGDDLFGSELAMASTFPERAEIERRVEAKKALRSRIRSVSPILRILLFPVWAVAEAYVTAMYREPVRVKAIAFLAPLGVGLLTGSIWFIVVQGVARSFE